MTGQNKLSSVKIKTLGFQEYLPVWEDMQAFTKNRDQTTRDEIWVVEHPPIYTLGRNGDESDLLIDTGIPVIKVDRGGQITYHGPGQIVLYLLLDLHRRKLGVRQLVSLIEDSIIDVLSVYKIRANSDKKAPGVYVDNRKIAALGIRVSRGCTTHGLSLNVDMDMAPFSCINPCGYAGLEVIQCKDLQIPADKVTLESQLLDNLISRIEKG